MIWVLFTATLVSLAVATLIIRDQWGQTRLISIISTLTRENAASDAPASCRFRG